MCCCTHKKKTCCKTINTLLTIFVLVRFVFNRNQLYKITVVLFLVKYTSRTPGSKKNSSNWRCCVTRSYKNTVNKLPLKTTAISLERRKWEDRNHFIWFHPLMHPLFDQSFYTELLPITTQLLLRCFEPMEFPLRAKFAMFNIPTFFKYILKLFTTLKYSS